MKLKPCPFCGGEVRIQLTDSEGNWKDGSYLEEPYSGTSYVIVHDETMVKGICPITTDESDEKSQGMWIYPTEESAIEVWNRRAPIEKIVEQLEDYKIKKYVSGITHNPYEFGACHAMDDAIKIVKKGGVV